VRPRHESERIKDDARRILPADADAFGFPLEPSLQSGEREQPTPAAADAPQLVPHVLIEEIDGHAKQPRRPLPFTASRVRVGLAGSRRGAGAGDIGCRAFGFVTSRNAARCAFSASCARARSTSLSERPSKNSRSCTNLAQNRASKKCWSDRPQDGDDGGNPAGAARNRIRGAGRTHGAQVSVPLIL
jgi:hypothetical protein